MRRIGTLLVLGLCAVIPAVARAQSLAVGGAPGAAVGDRGIALGDRLKLHLGIGAEIRYDSNVFYEASNPTAALALRLTPSLTLTTRGSSGGVIDSSGGTHKVELTLSAGLDYREWLYSNTGTRPPRQFNILANLNVTILPQGPVTIDLYDNYVRSSQPAYIASTTNFDRDLNELGFRLRIKPGGGRLELQLGYGFGIDFWETDQFQLNLYDNYFHHATARLLYKFLPKTSVYVQAEEYAYQYTNSSAIRPNGYPLRVIAGLNGLLTSKLTFDIYGGYINGFYQSGPTLSTGIAGLRLKWRPIALGVASLGYEHDASNTILGTFAEIDNVQISWAQQIWRFGAYLRLGYQNTRYQGIPPGAENLPSPSTRTDNSVTFDARLDYYAYRNLLALSVGYDLNLIRSDSALGTPTAVTTPADFTKHEVYLSVSVRY